MPRWNLHIAARPWLLACTLAFVSLWTGTASATASRRSPYTLKQVYSAALRLVRVDKNFEVTEKEPDIAYILFKYKSHETGNRSSRGSFEFIAKKGSVLILLKLPQMPSYHEDILMRSLAKKLRDEYGAPPARPKKPTRRPRGERRPRNPSKGARPNPPSKKHDTFRE